MLVNDAKEMARAWVAEEVARLPGFVGAFFSGSINEMAGAAELPATSDVDLLLVVEGPELPHKPGKFLCRGTLIEASYLSSADLATPEQVLSTSHLAWNLRADSLILDPTGRLASLREAVVKGYAQRRWVIRRCMAARAKVLRNFEVAGQAGPWSDRVISWLFGAGVTTHILLLAGLRNPTVRKRYLAVRELLAEYGATGFYPTLLEMLGCAHWSRDGAEQHLGTMAEVFDAASRVIQTPFAFAADIGPDGRLVAVDGSRELIERGDHREAVFWIAVTHSRCQQVLLADAPAEMHEQYLAGYMRMLADLGIGSSADLEQRVEQIKALLPAVWQRAEAIVDANSEIEGEPRSIKM
jgi:hypothetical protein